LVAAPEPLLFLEGRLMGLGTPLGGHCAPLENNPGDEAEFMDFLASITASATFGHSASPDNVTWWHIMARQGAMQVYVKYLDNFCHHNSLYFHHL